MSEKTVFFVNQQTINGINKFMTQISVMNNNVFYDELVEKIKIVLNAMLAEPKLWDKYCGLTIESIGSAFITEIIEYNSNELTREPENKLHKIFAFCYRFICELELSVKEDISIELVSVKSFAADHLDDFGERTKQQIRYSNYTLPTHILKRLITHDNITAISEFNKKIDEAINLKKSWDDEIARKEKDIVLLKEALEKYEDGFNFVGLYKGFDDISIAKRTEKNIILFFMVLTGIIAIMPLMCEIWYYINNVDYFRNIEIKTLLIVIVPTVSLVVILIYYFRVFLVNYKSVKSQLLQIELRKTLCRFIQSYADYASDIKQKDKELLLKFESIVFSGIVSDDEKLPTTFDGLDKIASFIKSLK